MLFLGTAKQPMESGLTAKQEAAPDPAFAFARVFIAEGTTPLVTVSLRLEKPFSSQMISLSGHVMTPSALHTPVNVIKRSSSEKAQPTTSVANTPSLPPIK
jgi:hypothetical protein